MHDCVRECVLSCNWKLRTLLRTGRFYNDRDLVNLYKAHVLSFIEFRTPGIFHAAPSVFTPLDLVQTRFLRGLGITAEDGLFHFSLAPLSSRRHIAALAVIHRAALGRGPPHFWRFFQRLDADDPRSVHLHHLSCLIQFRSMLPITFGDLCLECCAFTTCCPQEL